MSKENDLIIETLDKLIKDVKECASDLKYDEFEKSSSYKEYKKNRLKKDKTRSLISFWDVFLLGLINTIFLVYLCYLLAAYYNKIPNIDLATEYAKLKEASIKSLAKYWLSSPDIDDISKEDCAISIPDLLFPAFRPIDDCSMCINVKEIKRVSNISKEDFLENYAYSGVPVIVTDASQNWTAMKEIDFKFFKNLYAEIHEFAYKKRQAKIEMDKSKNLSPLLFTFQSIVETDEQRQEEEKDACQFFPYRTNFTSLDDLFKMEENDERWKKPWYIGWSNCNSYAADVLRKHYTRPYFLPDDSEISRIDWIFMGTPNYGAQMHIDNVDSSSWQAQISGIKSWTFVPPAECLTKCSILKTDIHPGDVFIFDSNRWFHSTTVKGDKISITIGSEYD